MCVCVCEGSEMVGGSVACTYCRTVGVEFGLVRGMFAAVSSISISRSLPSVNELGNGGRGSEGGSGKGRS